MTRGEFARGDYSAFVAGLVDAVVHAAEEKNALDTVVLDLRELVDSFDALVVTSERSFRQVRTLSQAIEERVDLVHRIRPIRVEGFAEGEWVALDYGDVIVHVFDESAREYYDLEHLWSAAPAWRFVAVR